MELHICLICNLNGQGLCSLSIEQLVLPRAQSLWGFSSVLIFKPSNISQWSYGSCGASSSLLSIAGLYLSILASSGQTLVLKSSEEVRWVNPVLIGLSFTALQCFDQLYCSLCSLATSGSEVQYTPDLDSAYNILKILLTQQASFLSQYPCS